MKTLQSESKACKQLYISQGLEKSPLNFDLTTIISKLPHLKSLYINGASHEFNVDELVMPNFEACELHIGGEFNAEKFQKNNPKVKILRYIGEG